MTFGTENARYACVSLNDAYARASRDPGEIGLH